MKAEISVLCGSRLIGRVIREVANDYDVNIDHSHNPHPSIETTNRDLSREITENMILCVEGEASKIKMLMDGACCIE
jgi:hypothetical protein